MIPKLIPNLIRSPRFQKWSLFTSLIASLGFNLSMNPQLANVARNEMHSIALASTETKAETKPAAETKPTTPISKADDPNLLGSGKVINLGESTDDERLNGYGVTLAKNLDGTKITYLVKKKKSGTEAYSTEGCDECNKSSIATPPTFNPANAAHIKAIIAEIADAEHTALAKAKKKAAEKATVSDDEKKDDEEERKRRSIFAESCQKKTDDELIDCQIEYIKDEAEKCLQKSEKWRSSCEKQLKAQFKPIEDLFRVCSNVKSKWLSEDDVDCAQANDFAIEIRQGIPSRFAISKSLEYSQRLALKGTTALHRKLVSRKDSSPFAKLQLKRQFDEDVGTYPAKVAQYDANGTFVQMVDSVSAMPRPNSESYKIFEELRSNEMFEGNTGAAADFFKRSYYDDLATIRTEFFKDPTDNKIKLYNPETGNLALPPPDLGNYQGRPELRGAAVTTIRANGIAIPAPPTIVDLGPAARPGAATPGTTRMTTPGSGLLSPAQRGQVRQ